MARPNFGYGLLVLLALFPFALHVTTSLRTGATTTRHRGQPFATMTRGKRPRPRATPCILVGTYAYTAGATPCSNMSMTATINAVVLNKSGASGNPINYFAYPARRQSSIFLHQGFVPYYRHSSHR